MCHRPQEQSAARTKFSVSAPVPQVAPPSLPFPSGRHKRKARWGHKPDLCWLRVTLVGRVPLTSQPRPQLAPLPAPLRPRCPLFSALSRFSSHSDPVHSLFPRPGRLCLQVSGRLVPPHPLLPLVPRFLVGPVLGTPCERPTLHQPRGVSTGFLSLQYFSLAVRELGLRASFSLSLGFYGKTCAPGSPFCFQHPVLSPVHSRHFDK